MFRCADEGEAKDRAGQGWFLRDVSQFTLLFCVRYMGRLQDDSAPGDPFLPFMGRDILIEWFRGEPGRPSTGMQPTSVGSQHDCSNEPPRRLNYVAFKGPS